MKRGNFIKSLATLITAPFMIEYIGINNDDYKVPTGTINKPNLPYNKVAIYGEINRFCLGDIIWTDLNDKAIVCEKNDNCKIPYIKVIPFESRTFRFKDINSIRLFGSAMPI